MQGYMLGGIELFLVWALLDALPDLEDDAHLACSHSLDDLVLFLEAQLAFSRGTLHRYYKQPIILHTIHTIPHLLVKIYDILCDKEPKASFNSTDISLSAGIVEVSKQEAFKVVNGDLTSPFSVHHLDI